MVFTRIERVEKLNQVWNLKTTMQQYSETFKASYTRDFEIT